MSYFELFKMAIFDDYRHGLCDYSSSVHYLVYNVGSSVRIKSFSDNLDCIFDKFEKLKPFYPTLHVVSFNFNVNQVL